MHRFLEEIAAHHMTNPAKAISPDTTMRDLLTKFEKDDFNAYPVCENDRVIGIITKLDCLHYFAFTPHSMVPQYEQLMRQSAARMMTKKFIYVRPLTKLTRVLQLLVEHRLRSMPVLEANQSLAGMISREDILRALKRCGDGGYQQSATEA
jgi:CBS domain-containing protein